MCYHGSTPGKKKLGKFFEINEIKIKVDIDFPEYKHISGFERPFLATTLNESQDQVSMGRWKLLPFWVKTDEEAKRYANTLNAVGEKIFESSSYKPYALKHRGLLWMDGFYEPHKAPGVKETENYFCHMPEHECFAVGIIYAPWTDQSTGEHYNTFSIITTHANKQFEIIHNEKKRMPLILPRSNWDAWLNSTDKKEVQELIQPYSEEMEAYQTVRVTASRGLTDALDVQSPIGKVWKQGDLN